MIDLNQYGYTGTRKDVARVLAAHRERYAVVSREGECFARLKSSVYRREEAGAEVPAVGDFVTLLPNPLGDALITGTLPRKSWFTRLNPSSSGHGEQILAANFDTVFLMTSLNQDLNLGRLERYLIMAHESGAEPVVLLTKKDLVEDDGPFLTRARGSAGDVPILSLSAHTGEGMEQLVPYLVPGKTVVFLGSSGVGKSSLLNALAGDEVMRVNAIREDDAKGRHTTTHREIFRLASGALVIDTPGMRELGLWDAEEGVDRVFADVEALSEGCRFSDCRHEREPGCAVKKALQEGALSQERWENYRKLRREEERTRKMDSYKKRRKD